MTVASAVSKKAARRPAVWAAPTPADSTLMGFALIPTTWGDCGVLWRTTAASEWTNSPAFAESPSEATLCRWVMPGMPPARLRTALQRSAIKTSATAAEVLPDGHGRFPRQLVPTWFGELAEYLREYFSDSLGADAHNHYLDVWTIWRARLDLAPLSPFRRKVLDLVAQIPMGEVRTYGQIARQAGRPTAARAVGAVMRTNPWPLLVPCHRVIGASGDLTGYSAPGRLVTKKRLLRMERGEGLE